MGGGPKWKLQSEARWEDAMSAFQEEDDTSHERRAAGDRGDSRGRPWRESHKQMQSKREEGF